MTKIEEISQRINEIGERFIEILNECQKALAELKESKKEGKWNPKEKDKYWFVSCYGKADFGFWNNDSIDIWRYNTMPLFKEKRECEKYKRFMDTVKEKSYEFSKEEWEDGDIIKNFICYDSLYDKFTVEFEDICKNIGTVYFKEKSDAQYIIDNFKDELMEYWI